MRRSLLLVVASLLALSCGPVAPPPSAPSQILDGPLPDLSGRTVDGARIDDGKLASRIVVVKFFAKFCKPCKKTLPEAERLHRDNPDVTFVGVAEDEYAADAREMIRTYALTFPVIHDPDNAVAGRFRVQQLPATFVTDRTGRVRWFGSAGQRVGDLEAVLDSVRQHQGSSQR
jgi:thiol-disulfide isomerase/thioredoxin